MKLKYKINIVAVVVMVAVGLLIALAGVSTITKVTYNLNQELMFREVENVVTHMESAHAVLTTNRLDGVKIYREQAQQEIVAELESYRYRATGSLFIINRDSKVVKHQSLPPGYKVDFEQATQMLEERSGSLEFSYNGEKRHFSYKYFPAWHWLIILSVSSEELLAPRSQFLVQVVIILLVCLVLGAAVFFLITGRIVAPIRQLAEATTFVSEGKWNTPLPQPRGSDEVALLTEAFRKMAVRLEELYGNLQKNLQQIEQSQSALRESEEKYRGLVELLPLVVFETDTQGKFVFANQYASDAFGYEKEEWSRNLYLHSILIKDNREPLKANTAKVMQGKDLGMMEYTGQRKDGATFPCLLLATPIYQGEESIGLRGICIDISERTILINELQLAREFLDTILNNVADPIYVKDEQHQLLLCNDAFCNFTNRRREEMIGRTEYDFFPREDANVLITEENLVLSELAPREKELTLNSTGGVERTILTKKTAFKDSEGKKMLVGIIKDITERKKLEQELFKNDKLKSIGVLAGGIAHDFNNILTAVIGNLSLAKMLADRESKIYRYIKASENASTRAKDLTQQLLTFSRGGAPVKQTVSLVQLIEELSSFILRGSKVRSEMDFPTELWPVDVDEGQISRVVHNIMMNGIQAMPGGGKIHLTASNYSSRSQSSLLPLIKGRYVKLLIKDHGQGIAPELLPNIFDPYFTTKENGSGLGLATAFSIVKRHGGHIHVDSELNKGSCFTIYLPASEDTVFEKEVKQKVLHRGKSKILVMDDEVIVRETVGAMLKTLGYRYEFADDGVHSLDLYKQAMLDGNPFDLVIMDLTIPGGMGGQEAIRELLAFDPDAKAIVASGYSKDPVMADFQQYGFAGVITKPFELEKLSYSLHRILHEDDT